MTEKLIDKLGNEAQILPDKNEIEFWKWVPGSSKYLVSSFGRVIGPRGEIKLSNDAWGYLRFSFYPDGKGEKRKTAKVHRLVCEAFYGPPPEGKEQCDHIDGCRENNYYKNLRWASPSENQKNRHKSYPLKEDRLSYLKTPILLIDKETFEVLEEFKSLYDAAEKLNMSYENIAIQVRGQRVQYFSCGIFMTRKQYIDFLNEF